jgi:hypothetical protein
MNFKTFGPRLYIFALFCLLVTTTSAHADYTQRLSLGVGIVSFQNPNESEFEFGAEYEYRLNPTWGLGLFTNVIFTNPLIVDIGAPEAFWHPFGSEFLISGAPLIELGQPDGTHVGVHFGTRLPLHLGALTIVPIFGIAFIESSTRIDYGLGLEF